jgi:predicted SAM-dependent methyltransferase
MIIELLRSAYRKIKYSIFTTPQRENFKFHFKRQKSLIDYYLQQNAVRKLQIGAQSNSIDGWLNVDLMPKTHEVIFMDATKPFPFPSSSIDYIYTEHMLEHISFGDAKFMIAECFRVLKKNGKIRISTPDLAFLIALYHENISTKQKEYIEFSVKRYLKDAVPSEDVYVINNFFRDWGHAFIHDIKSLSFLLSSTGFVQFRKCTVMNSEDVQFQRLEQHGKEISQQFNELESIIVEAQKP